MARIAVLCALTYAQKRNKKSEPKKGEAKTKSQKGREAKSEQKGGSKTRFMRTKP
jgi:hypothetical protein